MGRKRRAKRRSKRKKEAQERVDERRARHRPSPAKARLVLWVFALIIIVILAVVIIKLNRPDDDDDNGNGNGNGNGPTTNKIPVPHATANATTPYTYELITFDGSNSMDLDGRIVNFTWDFHRDWLTGEVVFSKYGMKFNISFNESGMYYVVLKVTDDDGAQNTTVSFNKYWGITLQVLNRPPVAVIDGGDQTVKVGQEVFLYADDSYDKDDTVLTYHWDFGDGNSSTDMITQHKYESAGEYTITLTVDDGEDDATDQIKVVVT
jgi:hypothetical protein